MEGVAQDVGPLTRWADVVSKTTDGGRGTRHVKLLPLAEEANEEVALELAVKHLRQEVKVADESCLKDDRDVAGVEKLDGVGVSLTTSALVLEREFDTEALLATEKSKLVLIEEAKR